MRTVTEHFKNFICAVLGRGPCGGAPTLSSAYPLQDRLWQLRVWLRQEVEAIVDQTLFTIVDFRLATGACRTVCVCNPASRRYPPAAISFSAHPACAAVFIPPSATDFDLWAYCFTISYRDSAYDYPILSHTGCHRFCLGMSHTLPAICDLRVHARRNVSSDLPSVFFGINLTLPGPHSCVY
jgi:hypothetical protein